MKRKSVLFLVLIWMVSTGAFASANKQLMQLMITDQTSHRVDLTYIYFAQGTSTSFSFPEDVQKSVDTTGISPQLYSLSSDGVGCYSNGYGSFTITTIVPLGIWATGDTVYSISLPKTQNFDDATLILLEDRTTGTFTNLRSASADITITQTGTISNRFYIHVTYPPTLSTTPSGCDNNSGVISITQDNSSQWTSSVLYDSSHKAIITYNNVFGNYSFSSLAAGTYSIAFVYNGYQAVKAAELAGFQITPGIQASAIHATVNQEIVFNSLCSNATDFIWELGDSTIVSGVSNTNYAYRQAGTYVVTLTATNNYPCMAKAYLPVYISEPTAIGSVAGDAVTISNNNQQLRIVTSGPGGNFNYAVYAVSGQLLQQGPITSADFNLNVSSLSAGIYMVSVKNAGGTYTKKIMVTK